MSSLTSWLIHRNIIPTIICDGEIISFLTVFQTSYRYIENVLINQW